MLSKCVIHRQYHHRKAAQQIQTDYRPTKSVVHWNGKLLHYVTCVDADKVDRQPVLPSSLVDGDTKLLGVPKVKSGPGLVVAEAIIVMVNSWQCN